jgi:catechol 2,3-dioxygenase-like lactoylglutathione lyase family enzyme/GNAT superfamily N-acetyltransferase
MTATTRTIPNAMPEPTFRTGSVRDVPALMTLFDDAVAWLVSIGRAAQWGSEPWSADRKKVDFIADLVIRGELTFAEVDGEIAGALIVNSVPMPYSPPVDEPEIYIHVLITSPKVRGKGIGSTLLDRARDIARERRVSLMRVDCWAGGDRRLVAYYVGQGFTPAERIDVHGQPVQVFHQRLALNEGDVPMPDTFGLGLHHVQLAIPAGSEDACREFYVAVLGMTEVEKPPELAARGGLWVRSGTLELHLGVEADFRPARKAHPGILVADLDRLAAHLTDHGISIEWDDNFPGYRRFYAYDPNGNRLEFLTPAG